MLKFCIVLLFVFTGELSAQSPGCIPAVTISTSENKICAGTKVTLHATVANAGTEEIYNWKKNNAPTGVNNSANYTSSGFNDGDVITCEYTCKTSCGVYVTILSQPVTMYVIGVLPVITIGNNDQLICEGETTLFTSSSSYGDAVPFYQWFVNGSPVGSNSPSYSTNSLTNGSRVECVLSVTTPSCPATINSATSQLTIYVYPMIHPAITVTASKSQICKGEEVTFTSKANGGASPRFSWEINGKPTGDIGVSLVTSSLKNGDSVSCTVTIDQDSRCHTSTSSPSNKVGIEVRDFPDPTLTIAAPILDFCSGASVIFTAISQNAGDYKSYQWQVNGRNTMSNSSTFITTELVNGDRVSCNLSTNIPGCTITTNLASNEKIVTVRKAPQIAFSPSEILVMSGEQATLNAIISGNTSSFVWTPDALLLAPQSLTSLTVPLARDTTFNLSVTDLNSCKASKDLVVKVFPQLYMPSAFTPNKDGKNDVFRIPPGSSLVLSAFAVFDRWGNMVFSTADITKGWNGIFGDRDLDTGTYVYYIRGVLKERQITIKGTITLIR